MDIVAAIHNAISKQQPEKPRKYLGASSISDPCHRKLWYSLNGYQGEPNKPKLQITFDIGRKLEDMLLNYLSNAGILVMSIEQFYQDSSVPYLQGHVDGVILLEDESKAILELKTANDASFNKFKKDGLLKWSESYYSQVQSYMGMSGIHKAVLLCINKNTSDLHHQWVQFDEIFYECLVRKASAISLAEEPPERISQSPFFFGCSQCRYKGICHDN